MESFDLLIVGGGIDERHRTILTRRVDGGSRPFVKGIGSVRWDFVHLLAVLLAMLLGFGIVVRDVPVLILIVVLVVHWRAPLPPSTTPAHRNGSKGERLNAAWL